MQTFSCSPYSSCACLVWDVRPKESVPLQIDFTGLLGSLPGWKLSSVSAATLTDLRKNPPAPADGTEIALVSGMAVDPVPAPTPGFTEIIEGKVTQNFIKTGDVAIGAPFRFDLTLVLIDCNGRQSILNECVVISIVAG